MAALADGGDRNALRQGIRALCASFAPSYWRDLERERAYPEAFVRALTEAGYLAAMIPEAYGGSGLGVTEGSIILEEINRSGGNAAACHAQMYTMAAVLRHGSEAQKAALLPAIARGEARLQAFAVTEPTSGSDTTHLETRATRHGAGYVVQGAKVFTSRVAHSDYLLLLARTTPLAEVARPTEGLSVFLVDLGRALGHGITATPIETMFNHETYALAIDGLELGADALVGREGEGFGAILDSMNAERILIAAECVGDGDWFVAQASDYARTRTVFGRPIGQNQGVAFPLARAHAAIRAADLMRLEAAARFDRGEACGAEANMAKLLASEASWQAANAAIQTFGGYGFVREVDVERKFRETRLYQVAPISTNLILTYLSERVLGLPRSY